MVKWISKISWGKLVLSGSLYAIFSIIVRQIEALITMRYYQMPEFFGVWSKAMMPASPAGRPSFGPPPLQFFISSSVMTLASGIMLGLVYYYVRDLLPSGFQKRVFFFADLMIGFEFIFFTLPVYLLFNVPLELLVSWFISGFIILLFASFVFVKILK